MRRILAFAHRRWFELANLAACAAFTVIHAAVVENVWFAAFFGMFVGVWGGLIYEAESARSYDRIIDGYRGLCRDYDRLLRRRGVSS